VGEDHNAWRIRWQGQQADDRGAALLDGDLLTLGRV
jgi:hypothetical protein